MNIDRNRLRAVNLLSNHVRGNLLFAHDFISSLHSIHDHIEFAEFGKKQSMFDLVYYLGNDVHLVELKSDKEISGSPDYNNGRFLRLRKNIEQLGIDSKAAHFLLACGQLYDYIRNFPDSEYPFAPRNKFAVIGFTSGYKSLILEGLRQAQNKVEIQEDVFQSDDFIELEDSNILIAKAEHTHFIELMRRLEELSDLEV